MNGWDEREILPFLEYVLSRITHTCTMNIRTTVRVRVRFDSDEKKISVDLLTDDNFGSLISRAISRIDNPIIEKHNISVQYPVRSFELIFLSVALFVKHRIWTTIACIQFRLFPKSTLEAYHVLTILDITE